MVVQRPQGRNMLVYLSNSKMGSVDKENEGRPLVDGNEVIDMARRDIVLDDLFVLEFGINSECDGQPLEYLIFRVEK